MSGKAKDPEKETCSLCHEVFAGSVPESHYSLGECAGFVELNDALDDLAIRRWEE